MGKGCIFSPGPLLQISISLLCFLVLLSSNIKEIKLFHTAYKVICLRTEKER